jgi:hypothetical protein
MSQSKKLVIVNSRGFDDERSSVACGVVNTGATSDMEVTAFLAAAGVGWVHRGAASLTF